ATLLGKSSTGKSNAWPVWIFPKVTPDRGDVLITTDAAAASDALSRGAKVLYLGLDGFHPIQPGVQLGWWSMNNQRGVAIASHPAFGDFPYENHLSPVMFHLVKNAAPAGGALAHVEPLMVGRGNAGYLLYVFQARVGEGRLL